MQLELRVDVGVGVGQLNMNRLTWPKMRVPGGQQMAAGVEC